MALAKGEIFFFENSLDLKKIKIFMLNLKRQIFAPQKASIRNFPPIGKYLSSVKMHDDILVSLRHRGGRIQKINAWYLNTHMVYL